MGLHLTELLLAVAILIVAFLARQTAAPGWRQTYLTMPAAIVTAIIAVYNLLGDASVLEVVYRRPLRDGQIVMWCAVVMLVYSWRLFEHARQGGGKDG